MTTADEDSSSLYGFRPTRVHQYPIKFVMYRTRNTWRNCCFTRRHWVPTGILLLQWAYPIMSILFWLFQSPVSAPCKTKRNPYATNRINMLSLRQQVSLNAFWQHYSSRVKSLICVSLWKRTNGEQKRSRSPLIKYQAPTQATYVALENPKIKLANQIMITKPTFIIVNMKTRKSHESLQKTMREKFSHTWNKFINFSMSK